MQAKFRELIYKNIPLRLYTKLAKWLAKIFFDNETFKGYNTGISTWQVIPFRFFYFMKIF